MPEDILAELRAKEQQMEALISDARGEAASIREAALQSAREIKARGLSELDEELRPGAEEKTKR
jgi:vacuolar-type H+-ATPase subunit H